MNSAFYKKKNKQFRENCAFSTIRRTAKSSSSFAVLLMAAAVASLAPGDATADSCPTPTTILGTSSTDTCTLTTGESVLITEDGKIVTSGTDDGIVFVDGADRIENRGTIHSADKGIYGHTIVLTGDLINSGLIQSDSDHALHFYLSDIQGDINNSGTIDAVERGIYGFQSSLSNIFNSGLITSDTNHGIYVNVTDVRGDIINSGTIDVAINGIHAKDSQLTGLIENTGTIEALSNGIYLLRSDITGGVTNTGDLLTGANGIYLEESTAGGSVTSSGTIDADSDGFYIKNATIKGDLINTGSITAYNEGYDIDRQSTIEGKVANEGSIIAEDGQGIEVDEDSHVHQGLFNTGTIQANEDGIAVSTNSIVDKGLHNSGTIRSVATGVPGLQHNAIRIYANGQVNGGVHNSGTLQGDMIGVALETGGTIAGDLVNTGTIEGQTIGVSIDAGGNITGKLVNRGTIQGGIAAVQFEPASYLGNPATTTPIEVDGSDARFIGDVFAPDAGMILKTGTDHAMESAYYLKSLTVEEGATFTPDNATSTFAGNIHPTIMAAEGFDLASSLNISGGLNNAGTVVIKAGPTIRLHGGYTQSGVFQVQIRSASDHGQLAISGAADLGPTMKIDVDVTADNSLSVGEGIDDILVADGGITGADAFSITDNSALLDFTPAKDGNTIDLVVEKGLSVEEAITNEGNTPGEGAAQVVDDLIDEFIENGTTGNAEVDQVLNTLGSLATQKEVSDAIRQVLPLHAASQPQVVIGSIRKTGRIIQARQEGQLGHSSGDSPISSEHAWVKPFGSWTDQSDRNGVSGFSANSYGLSLGADAMIGERSRLGVAFSYTNSNVNSNSTVARQKSDMDSYHLAVYGSYSLTGATQLNLQADAGLHDNEGTRQIDFMGQAAKADYNSWSGHLGAGVAHRLEVAEGTTFTPGIRADYIHIYDQSYRENGAGALNLHVDSTHTQEFLLTAEGKVVHDLTDRVSLTANAGVSYDLINDQASITSAFAGAPTASFTTEGLDPSPWIGHGGLGVSAKLTDTMTLSVNYDIELREDFNNQSASAKLRWAF
ncbi:autotransporter family protein [Sneathiella chinensis]|uniref:Autotransporter domain-containing protein n=1 Tax=Sneathiella chinensis TaxID=349750 RepID=A0ABQ5U620_9PROT|nr:autotransporter outer membrane beta-barrel domain-containing protein [Sneathiella chinensis]GLQ07231.1 hypothetical protein GCM10007924_24520 [Sneathiella chinensis]